jgi:LPXTG-motif cell wall-anchored protein
MSIYFDESLLATIGNTPYMYDPTPPSPLKDPSTGRTIYSNNARQINYKLRSYKKPYDVIPLKVGTPSVSSFSVLTLNNQGLAVNFSNLDSNARQNIISTQVTSGITACNADPNCWGIGIENTYTNDSARRAVQYNFNYYSKPPALSTPSATIDPIELLTCDFTNKNYTFIKSVAGQINSTPIDCTPPYVAPTTTSTSTNAPVAGIVCEPNMEAKDSSTPNYYYCLALQATPPAVNIWSKPTTWIIIFVLLLVVGGGGYYFWKKRNETTDTIDYSKYLQKAKGGYYFLV